MSLIAITLGLYAHFDGLLKPVNCLSTVASTFKCCFKIINLSFLSKLTVILTSYRKWHGENSVAQNKKKLSIT
jgi:hypothetical protein